MVSARMFWYIHHYYDVIILQTVNLELTGRTVKRTADIARTGSRVISRTDTALPAVSRGTRQTFARHTFVSK